MKNNQKILATVAAALFAGLSSLAQASDVSSRFAESWANAQKYVPGLGEDVVNAACREGSVMLYSLNLGGNSKAIVDKFKQRFPCVDLNTFLGSGGVLVQRFTSEFNAGVHVADVWMNTSPLYGNRLVEKNMLMNWIPPTGQLIPALWKNEGYWYALGLANLAVVWNTDEIDAKQKAWLDNLKSWEQLASAPFSDSLAIVDARAGGSMQLLYYFYEHTYGLDYWRKLSALNPTIFSSITPLVGRLTAGEFSLGVGATADTVASVQLDKGAPLQWKFPEPALAVPYFIGIAAKSPHPNAAKLLMAWSLSEDGQTTWVNSTGLAPASRHAQDRRSFAKLPWYKLPTNYYNADWQAIGAQLKEQLSKFASIFRK